MANQAGLESAIAVDISGPLVYVGGQIAIVGLFWLVGMVWGAVEFWRRPVAETGEHHPRWTARFLVLATAVPWLIFLGFSLITKTQPNWPVVAVLSGTIVLPAWLRRRWRATNRHRRLQAFIAAGVLSGATAVVVIHHTEWITPALAWLARGAPPWDLTPVARYDPSAKMRGWSQLGAAVGAALQQQRAAGREPFILAQDYQLASEIAFYCPGQPVVYAAQAALGQRRCQYDVWTNPIRDAAQFVGRPCLYIGSLHETLTGHAGERAVLPRLERVRTVEYKMRGQVVRLWTVWSCDAFAGFDLPATARLE